MDIEVFAAQHADIGISAEDKDDPEYLRQQETPRLQQQLRAVSKGSFDLTSISGAFRTMSRTAPLPGRDREGLPRLTAGERWKSIL